MAGGRGRRGEASAAPAELLVVGAVWFVRDGAPPVPSVAVDRAGADDADVPRGVGGDQGLALAVEHVRRAEGLVQRLLRDDRVDGRVAAAADRALHQGWRTRGCSKYTYFHTGCQSRIPAAADLECIGTQRIPSVCS